MTLISLGDSCYDEPIGFRHTGHKVVVGREGLEPSKALPADLQSAPFAARDTDPLDLLIWRFKIC